ncbi:substrate-binding domain-containing protein [Geobacter pelophilus]|uniref:Substrate-binding domain-containing protein n=1 Tax=Geoanaerobacter pelophilus TaxID=60036 RepID=A0AAW4L486_9BACT|nr:substrate-binding domain-containing protein [Geoanaerobacter pelophilus]MBT0662859.1 substrate-binding domain-containing protein [Geoanaerobacter pelophilus]
MKKLVLLLAIAMVAATSAQAETIKIGGSGSMIPLLTQIGKAYVKKYPQDSVEVNQKSLGQPGGIAALNAGAVDIAMSAMEITPEQKKLGVQPIEIAQVAGVIGVSGNVTVKELTSQQLCDIYGGKIKNWKQVGGADAPIAAFTRPESDSTKQMFRKGAACMANLKEAPEIMNLAKTADMHNALETKPNAIGPVDAIGLAMAKGKFKAIKIDGKSFEGLASGKWPFVLHNNLVLGKNKGEAVKRFLGFIKSPEGQAIIKGDKALPIPFSF